MSSDLHYYDTGEESPPKPPAPRPAERAAPSNPAAAPFTAAELLLLAVLIVVAVLCLSPKLRQQAANLVDWKAAPSALTAQQASQARMNALIAAIRHPTKEGDEAQAELVQIHFDDLRANCKERFPSCDTQKMAEVSARHIQRVRSMVVIMDAEDRLGKSRHALSGLEKPRKLAKVPLIMPKFDKADALQPR